MATYLGRLNMAMRAGVNAFRRTMQDPAGKAASSGAALARYDHLWSLYTNAIFDDYLQAASYRLHYNLYRNIRGLYNPVTRLVNFYASFVYPGALKDALPIETENDLIQPALDQVWQWSNWLECKANFVRNAAAMGDSMAVIVDDLARGKVYLEVVDPRHVPALTLDAQGNVKAYRIEYQVEDGGREYTYARTVDQEAIRTYRNGNLFDYDGAGAEIDNPYGFVPAVWVRHLNLGADRGEPAFFGSFQKMDEACQLISAINDRIMAIINSPIITWTSANTKGVFNQAKKPATAETEAPEAFKDAIKVLKMPPEANAKIEMLQLDIEQSYKAYELVIDEIRKDFPELTVHEQLRQMSQVTGPAAERMMGDAVQRVADAQASYDQQSVKLFQMALAIAGWRAQSGGWGGRSGLSVQRQAFTPFNLDSYGAGDLDMQIAPRPLIRETKLEKAQTLAAETGLGVTKREALRELGYSEEKIQEMMDETAANREAMGRQLLGAFDRGQA